MLFYEDDNLIKKKSDRKLVGNYEDWEVKELQSKYNATEEQIRKAIDKYGPSREKVEAYLLKEYGLR